METVVQILYNNLFEKIDVQDMLKLTVPIIVPNEVHSHLSVLYLFFTGIEIKRNDKRIAQWFRESRTV